VTSLAFLVDQLFLKAPGGIGTYVRELVPALSRAEPSLDITLFHSRFESPSPEDWMGEYPRVEVPASLRRLYPGWALARRPPLPSPLTAHDLIHSPVSTAVPPAGARQRLVVTVHDLAFLVHRELFPVQWRAMHRAGLFRAVRSADAIITVSRHTAEDLVRHRRIDQERIYVVPLAASLPQVGSDVEETLARLKIRAPYVLFVGTLEPRKNLVRLVRAFRRVAVRGAPHALVLAGPIGWRHHQLMRELAVEAPGEIILTGETSEADRDALYRGASVFVYPSLYEGFGLPVLEAMARGVPCVVSTSSSLPEVAGEAALPVDPRSVAGLTEAIERAINDQALASRLSAAGKGRADRFSWEETARQTLEVYKSIL
jgi:glycosyltransferase involved in cell wall biosynthesis